MTKTNPQKNQRANHKRPDFTGQDYIMKVRHPRPRQQNKKTRVCVRCMKTAIELDGLHKKLDSVTQILDNFGVTNVENKYTYSHFSAEALVEFSKKVVIICESSTNKS
ncbi:1370_t:CDS:2 [Paraglomus brasilianum]|uniref:1370_t:CDS:1 n=1 Tax=Paraglomus brasilianum TaxID=144538 RepID=A0A9N9DUE0_9GLOM|nr:1370_t:CDS:2 [Paraglomus brasilianum]